MKQEYPDLIKWLRQKCIKILQMKTCMSQQMMTMMTTMMMMMHHLDTGLNGMMAYRKLEIKNSISLPRACLSLCPKKYSSLWNFIEASSCLRVQIFYGQVKSKLCNDYFQSNPLFLHDCDEAFGKAWCKIVLIWHNKVLQKINLFTFLVHRVIKQNKHSIEIKSYTV